MKPRRLLPLLALVLTAALVAALPLTLRPCADVPGLTPTRRTLLRVWVTSAPGGAQAWLTQQLRAFEKQHPGVMTHLRIVSPEEFSSPDAVLPDIVLCMPGDLSAPAACFAPLSADEALLEPLLQSGRCQGEQYGLPLCWGAWVLALDSALDPVPAATPAPTTLLGRPSATPAPQEALPYPLAAVSQAECPLMSPGGTALFALSSLLPPDARPPLPEDFARHTAQEVYAAFQARRCVSAMLTTGQATAFSALVSGGGGFPFRILVPEEIVTDQVWLAHLTPDAPGEAAELLAFLTGRQAQQALSAQGLHTVRDDVQLYASGFSAQVEEAARRSLSAMNAYLPLDAVLSAAWQALHQADWRSALPPLL